MFRYQQISSSKPPTISVQDYYQSGSKNFPQNFFQIRKKSFKFLYSKTNIFSFDANLFSDTFFYKIQKDALLQLIQFQNLNKLKFVRFVVLNVLVVQVRWKSIKFIK